jgi:hypothetical protein
MARLHCRILSTQYGVQNPPSDQANEPIALPLAGGDPERYLALVVLLTLTLGVLILGVLPGVLLTVLLSLLRSTASSTGNMSTTR